MEKLLHELLPELRKKADLSQGKLSMATAREGDVGVSVETIRKYESPKRAGAIPEVEILDALASALGVRADVFYEYPIALARRQARPAVSQRRSQLPAKPKVAQRARAASQRLDGTPTTSPRKKRAQGDEGEGK